MASAKTAKPKAGTKNKPTAPATSIAERWAQDFMRPEHVPEFLKRVGHAESFFNDPKQGHKLSEVDWINQWMIIGNRSRVLPNLSAARVLVGC